MMLKSRSIHQPVSGSRNCAGAGVLRVPGRGTASIELPRRARMLPLLEAAAESRGGAVLPTTAAAGPNEQLPESPRPGFVELGIDRLFMAGLAKMKVTRPSAIQASVIPEILSTDNVAMQSYTGSGKTLAFLLPSMTLAIERAEAMYKAGQTDVPLQLLVVAPSQELAMQIVRVAQGLLPDEHRRMVQQCIGGANPKYQMDALLLNKPLVVVGTPGRVSEFVRLGALKMHSCPIMVLDEADQLLAPNFSEDMNHINAHCGKSAEARQTVMVSATLSLSVLSKMAKWSPRAPRFVTAGAPAPKIVLAENPDGSPVAVTGPSEGPTWGWGATGPASEAAPKTQGAAGGVEGSQGLVPTMPPNLRHLYMVVEQRHKADVLRRCIHALDAQRVLVFMNYQQRLRDTMYKLEARRMKVASLHGEMEKMARSNILNDFRRGRLRALVVSDVVARGLDVSECDAVFHAELPSSASHYAHRAGRTGRMDAPGTVVSIVTQQEVFVMEKLSKSLGVPILEAHVERGQVILGPAPATLRYDDDDDDDRERPSTKTAVRERSGNEGLSREEIRAKAASIKAAAAAGDQQVTSREASSSQADVSGRSNLAAGSGGAAKGVAREAAVKKGALPITASPAGASGSETARSKTKKPIAHNEDSDDDDDGAELDVSQLEKQLQRAKAGAGGRALPPSGNTKLSSGIKSELQKEPEALHGEKSDAKVARRSARDPQADAPPPRPARK